MNLEGLTEQRLLPALDSLETQDPQDTQKHIFESVRKHYRLRDSGIVYEVTHTYLYGKKCPWGKEGKDKERVRGRPRMQIGLAIAQETGIPVFHQTLDGNIHDSRTFRAVISCFGRYDLEPGGLVIYDRGMTSGRHSLDVKALHWDTLCGVALNPALERVWRHPWAAGHLEPYRHYVPLHDSVF